eukprot:TRINITY_DN5984_c0_g1_i3.p1 TRINITY_DN5984_c0_g1~~TRINITY_DN5984_c0_g1_i3.p1  ORF type:complete len:355 (+),score=46.32 TRINITY_DN5984_c0_g1_i3:310-1374(+)
MALRKTLAHRLFNMTKISSQTPISANPTPNTFFRKFLNPPSESNESGFFRRWLQKRGIFNSAVPPECLSLQVGDKLIERLRGMNGDRLRLDGLRHPGSSAAAAPAPSASYDSGISVEDARKLLRVSQLEMVKSALRGVSASKSSVSYREFVEIVSGRVGSDPDEVTNLVRKLDESGVVIVLGNVVFLRPEQVVKAIESAIPLSLDQQNENDPRRQELEEMEEEKSSIDEKAEASVRRELLGGLGFLVLQTAGFMRLTFWELSWDVMEPICFYVTSIYFVAAYTFFLRTSKEPSFEGYFESRFSAKQKRLMKVNKFDVQRFNELRSMFNLSSSSSSSSSSSCNGSKRKLLGAIYQ